MLEGRVQHSALLAVSAASCILGALALTIGIFMYYGCEYYPYATCLLTGGGSLGLCLGIGVGNYTKWRCRR